MGGLIYLLTSPSGKHYIGQTTQTFERRWSCHKATAKSKRSDGCVALNSALRKYGCDKFSIEILVVCNISDLDSYETKFIEIYNSVAPNGYNLMLGGHINKKHSELTKEKMRISQSKRPELSEGKSYNYRKNPLTIGWPRYLGIYKGNVRLAKHPKCAYKLFNDKTKTFEENLEYAKKFLDELNKNL